MSTIVSADGGRDWAALDAARVNILVDIHWRQYALSPGSLHQCYNIETQGNLLVWCLTVESLYLIQGFAYEGSARRTPVVQLYQYGSLMISE